MRGRFKCGLRKPWFDWITLAPVSLRNLENLWFVGIQRSGSALASRLETVQWLSSTESGYSPPAEGQAFRKRRSEHEYLETWRLGELNLEAMMRCLNNVVAKPDTSIAKKQWPILIACVVSEHWTIGAALARRAGCEFHRLPPGLPPRWPAFTTTGSCLEMRQKPSFSLRQCLASLNRF